MPDERWRLLAELAAEPQRLSALPPGFYGALAERMEEAVGSPRRGALAALSEDLVEVFHAALREAPAGAAAAARGDEGGADAVAAYRLGQLGFAQLFASSAASRRADDRFMTVLRSKRYRRYLRALEAGERTNQALAEICRERTETVSRKLRVLRVLGIADVRREGTAAINLLTPAARAALAAEPGDPPEPAAEAPLRVPQALRERSRSLPDHMRRIPSFASTPAVAGQRGGRA